MAAVTGAGLLMAAVAVMAAGCSLTLDTDCEGLCPVGYTCQDGSCVAVLPTVTGINGDGAAREVVDEQGLLSGIDGRVDAANRMRTAWFITGERLEQVTLLTLELEEGGTSFVYRDSGSGKLCLTNDAFRCFDLADDGESWKLHLPVDLVEGAYRLRLGTVSGEESVARVMVLRGEKGEPGESSQLDCQGGTCTLDSDLRVAGDLDVGGATQAGDLATTQGALELVSLALDRITIERKVELAPCPQGYRLDEDREDIVLCSRSVADGRLDQVVRVGDFWIDRYEASAWQSPDCTGPLGAAVDDYPATFPDDGRWTTPVYACSLPEVAPARQLTWFQAQQACLAAGKHLCSNAQWQAGVADTFDPGIVHDQAQCNTASMDVRNTGLAGSEPGDHFACISAWGTEDQIGNLAEWVAEWMVAGQPPDDLVDNIYEQHPWPAAFGDDLTRNANGQSTSDAVPVHGLPAAMVRGGDSASGDLSGAFALDARWAPSHADARIGLRCCLTR